MSKVEVFHDGVHVANVTVPAGYHGHSALEYAWRWTNNVEGSWSRKEKTFEDGETNKDYNDNVEVLAPLHCGLGGKTYGLRSSMVGDRFVLDGVAYRVASCGFEKE